MRTVIHALLMPATLFALSGAALHAADQAPAAAKPYPLTTCIVTDEKLDSMGGPLTKVYDGQEVKFCCKGCVKDFEKDQAKYLVKLQKAPAPAGAADAKPAGAADAKPAEPKSDAKKDDHGHDGHGHDHKH